MQRTLVDHGSGPPIAARPNWPGRHTWNLRHMAGPTVLFFLPLGGFCHGDLLSSRYSGGRKEQVLSWTASATSGVRYFPEYSL